MLGKHTLRGWSEGAGHISLLFTREIYDVNLHKETGRLCVVYLVIRTGTAITAVSICKREIKVQCERKAGPGNVHINGGGRSNEYIGATKSLPPIGQNPNESYGNLKKESGNCLNQQQQ